MLVLGLFRVSLFWVFLFFGFFVFFLVVLELVGVLALWCRVGLLFFVGIWWIRLACWLG